MKIVDWDQNYRENNTPWDKGTPAPPLADWIRGNTLTGQILVPGCGCGHDVALLMEQGWNAIGLDIAAAAVTRAQNRYPRLAERFHAGDLFATPADWLGRFDAIVEHTCLCALSPEWRVRYRDAVQALLRPGGILVGVWYINPEMDPGESGPPFGISLEELDALFGESFDIIEDFVPVRSYPGCEGRERLQVLKKKQSTQS